MNFFSVYPCDVDTSSPRKLLVSIPCTSDVACDSYSQIASLFAVYVVGYIDICKLRKIIYMHMISLALCFVLMFGNSMLLTSYYASSLVIIWVIQGCFWLFGTVILKYLTSKIFGIADDVSVFLLKLGRLEINQTG
eukprot:bmy_07427T0